MNEDKAACPVQADAEYIARHYPWHEKGDGCERFDSHIHGTKHILYWPEPVEIDKPPKGTDNTDGPT